MDKLLYLAVCAMLAACAATPRTAPDRPASPCDVSEASYECQVERYFNVNVP